MSVSFAAKCRGVLGSMLVVVGIAGCQPADRADPANRQAQPASAPAGKQEPEAAARPAPLAAEKPAAQSPVAAAGAQEKTAPSEQGKDPQPAAGEQPEKPRDLGPPLVDNLGDLKRLEPYPAWLDPKNKQLVILGEVCGADYPLEFFATMKDRAYESVVITEARPSVLHHVLLLLGAVAGRPSKYHWEGNDLKFTPATGTEVAIEVRWKDKAGKQHQAPAQQWVRNRRTKKAVEVNWVFAGSAFWKDESGKERYSADGGDFICVLNNPVAMLDLPIQSSSAIDDRLFETFTENIPPLGTAVTILLRPKVEGGKK